jgi:hypothetical protein
MLNEKCESQSAGQRDGWRDQPGCPEQDANEEDLLRGDMRTHAYDPAANAGEKPEL